MVSEKRFYYIDYIKVLACFAVIAVHFRYHVQKAIPVNALEFKDKLFFALDYQLFVVCVPLFLICTGFLMNQKKYSLNYFISLIRIYVLYVICSIITSILFYVINDTPIVFKELLYNTLSFKQIHYAWYLEMYISLYCIIPLLNKIVGSLSKEELKKSIYILLLVVSVPKFINSVGPINHYVYIPSFWSNMYPIVYYLIGSYFRLFNEGKNSKGKSIFGSYILIVSLGVLINLINSTPYVGESEGGYGSIIIVIESVLLFILLKQINYKKNIFIEKVSRLTLPIFLMSFSIDQLFYPRYIQFFGGAKEIVKLFVGIVIIHFLLSLVLAFLVDRINNGIFKLFYKINKTSMIE